MRFLELPRTLGAVVLALAAAWPAAAQAPRASTPPASPRRDSDSTPRPFAWWRSEPFKKELGVTTEQSGHLDKLWQTTRPELRQEWDELSRLESKLSALIQSDADEATLSRQIDRVETARANANKTRALMLVQMRKVLSPEQRLRFDEIHDRWQPDRSGQPDRNGQSDRNGRTASPAPPASPDLHGARP